MTGATLDIAAGAAELRRADRNGCTLGRRRAWRASSNRGSARARYCDIGALDHRSEAAVRYPIVLIRAVRHVIKPRCVEVLREERAILFRQFSSDFRGGRSRSAIWVALFLCRTQTPFCRTQTLSQKFTDYPTSLLLLLRGRTTLRAPSFELTLERLDFWCIA
jgi:hypothetical protein